MTHPPSPPPTRHAPHSVGRLYRDISEDPRYGHYARIPGRTYRCLEHFGVAPPDRAAVVEALTAYYLFIGVADDALDSGGLGAGAEVLRRLRARDPSFDEATRRSRLCLATEVLKCHVAPEVYAHWRSKLERLYRAAVAERESRSMAEYVAQRRAVGRLTAEVSYLLVRPLLARDCKRVRRFLREVGEVGCLVDSAIDLRSDGRLGLLRFRPAPADYLRLAARTLRAGLRVASRHPRLSGLFLEAVGDDLRDRLRARRPGAGPEFKVSGLEFRV